MTSVLVIIEEYSTSYLFITAYVALKSLILISCPVILENKRTRDFIKALPKYLRHFMHRSRHGEQSPNAKTLQFFDDPPQIGKQLT